MTSYTVSYDKLEGNAKRAKAIEDIIGYLGYQEFVRISLAIHAGKASGDTINTPRDLRIPLMMCGVQGYPVKAWFELLFGELTPEQEAIEAKAAAALKAADL